MDKGGNKHNLPEVEDAWNEMEVSPIGGERLEIHWKTHQLRQATTRNLCHGEQILCHDSSLGISKTSNPTHLGMAYLPEPDGCNGGK